VKYLPIAEIAEKLVTGKTPPSKIQEYFNGNINWYNPSDIGLHKKLCDSKRKLSEGAITDKKVNLLPSKSLLITCIGDIGRVGIIESTATTNQQITALIPKKTVDTNYLYYWFLLNKHSLENLSNNAVVPILNNRQLSTIKIPLPSLSTQRRIAEVLDKADAIRRRNREMLKKYDQLAQSVFLDMFGDPVRNEKGWEKASLQDLVHENCPLTYGIVQPGEEFKDGKIVVRPIDLTKTIIGTENLKKIDPEISKKFKRTLLKGGEILMCVRGTTGLASIAGKILCGANVTRGITPIWFGENFNTWFAYYQLLSTPIQRLIQEKTYGIALKQINLKDLRQMQLINPPITLQVKYGEIIKNIEAQRQMVHQKAEKSEKLFQSLLQRAFKGELFEDEETLQEA
jgi:type I restriction enzyme S subunit